MRPHLLDTLPHEERQLISHALLSLGILPQSRESLDEWARGSLSPRSRFTDWLAEAIKAATESDSGEAGDVEEQGSATGVRALLRGYYDVLRAGEVPLPSAPAAQESPGLGIGISGSGGGGGEIQNVQQLTSANNEIPLTPPSSPTPLPPAASDALLVLLPLLIVLSTLLFLLLIFLIFVVLLRRRRGVVLRDHDGPLDLSREDIIEGEGGLEGVEQRWLETVSEEVRRDYRRAKEWQQYNPPNSLPTDITLSQFLSIQEKGVSAWSFEPDYLSTSVLIQSRTEITFLSSTDAATSVQSNLPLPKLNEVYYWEVKMFDKPESTSVSVGLATKPYPSFRMPGWAKHSVAYHSDGSKSYNYPFLSSSYGPHLLEGDTLGVGFRPRTGTVFFTRNGKKLEDAFIGLTRHNLFPTVGADGPCTVHVNLGQAGFVYIEANVKKWGLAPGVGTLAPPPAYGSERGSILLESGGATPSSPPPPPPPLLSTSPSEAGRQRAPGGGRRTHRSRRGAKPQSISSLPAAPSPLRTSISSSAPAHGSSGSALRRPAAVQRQRQEGEERQETETEEGEETGVYVSPTDFAGSSERVGGWRARALSADADVEPEVEGEPSGIHTPPSPHSPTPSQPETPITSDQEDTDASEPDSSSAISQRSTTSTPPQSPGNPPTPHVADISMRSFTRRPSESGRRAHQHQQQQQHRHTHEQGERRSRRGGHSRTSSTASTGSTSTVVPPPRLQPAPAGAGTAGTAAAAAAAAGTGTGAAGAEPPTPGPPAYTPLDANRYPDGVALDLPEEVVAEVVQSGYVRPPPQQQQQQQSGRR